LTAQRTLADLIDTLVEVIGRDADRMHDQTAGLSHDDSARCCNYVSAISSLRRAEAKERAAMRGRLRSNLAHLTETELDVLEAQLRKEAGLPDA
jgi:hypothetical protein